MPSRREQLFSYQFMVQRLISAFVYRDAELVQVPFRRAAGNLFIGAMLGVLALAAVGVYGVINPGGKASWKNDKVLVVEKETGARYVYLNNELHPVVNYASARLILKQSGLKTVSVSQASLRAAPRGVPLGIVGAPDSLPEAAQLVRGDWLLCSQPATNEAGQSITRSVLLIGAQPQGGRPLVDDEGLLVRHPDRTIFLIWHDRRYQIRKPEVTLGALALGQAPVIAAAPAWINAIPQGADMGPISIDGRGGRSQLRDARVGQVVVARSQSGENQFFAVLADGITDITPVQADLLINDPATAAAYPDGRVEPIQRTDLIQAKRSARRLLPQGDSAPPQTTPRIATGVERSGLCTTFAGAAAPQVLVGAAVPAGAGAGAAAGPGGSAQGTPRADRVVVGSGLGALVQSMISPDATGGALSVVTDLGVRHPLTGQEVAGYLGYDPSRVVRMPAGLVALLPEGPPLDPNRATAPAEAP
ncbi:type VII secretion protein EccB [Rhizomonospora bruguierae]|uniref:type VII secretion protein EccB n=1 Tax=Rhizomonospora bruguierae TaxID=1581705 RepID=UPI001BD174B4|nr:type VII secretion protein EccB [Micromonospora sp. NBRC 107566]